MATSSVPVEVPAPAQHAPAPAHRDFYAEGQSQPYDQYAAPHQQQQQPYQRQYQHSQPPQSPFYVFNPSMPYPNDKPGAQATGHFSPYQAPPPTMPVEFRYAAQPHGRSKRLTRSVLALHVVFLLFGLSWLGLSAYVMSYNGKQLGFSSGELLFLLSAIASVITDGTAIGFITVSDKLPSWTSVLDLLTIILGVIRFIPGVESRPRVVLGDADYDTWSEHMWVASIVSIFLLIAVICFRILSIISLWLWQSRDRRGMVQSVAVPMM